MSAWIGEPTAAVSLVANSVVLKADQGAQDANIFYWHRAQPLVSLVVERLLQMSDDRVRGAAQALLDEPASAKAYRQMCEALEGALRTNPEAVAEVCRLAWNAISRTRLDYHVGAGYAPDRDVTVEELAAASAAEPALATNPRVLVVVPFRDRSGSGDRVRNLLACLRSLRDQSLDRADYHVCVVESDDRPRWGELIAAHADQHLFAPKSGAFNKCWAVNVGVRHARGEAELICVLDADALVDRDFLRRNSERFRRPGTGGFLPFRDLCYLDASASSYAIRARCLDGRPEADRERLRGFLVHRAPGVCVWLRRDVFDAINGMDERYEGWGREDMDFVLRATLATAFVHFDDVMLHLYHPSSAHLVDGQTGNAHIPWLTWAPEQPIGQLDRFA